LDWVSRAPNGPADTVLWRNHHRENVEKQSNDLALKQVGDIVGRGETRLVGGRAVERNHHILDHRLLLADAPKADDIVPWGFAIALMDVNSFNLFDPPTRDRP
jgi:hypothetical protein